MAVDTLRAHKERQAGERLAAGAQWSEHDLVFATRTGGALDAANVRREFKAACKAAQIGEHWTPRELRHSFVSLMSSSGVPVEEIARLAGHSNTRTTEVVYRRELRPVLTTGAEAMDKLFPSPPVHAGSTRRQRTNSGHKASLARSSGNSPVELPCPDLRGRALRHIL
jgi:integrase